MLLRAFAARARWVTELTGQLEKAIGKPRDSKTAAERKLRSDGRLQGVSEGT